jgi:iron complex outermembrane recepter protein
MLRLGVSVMLPWSASIASGADADATDPTDHLEEVVVTSRKREEDLQQVPLSVNAYGGQELRERSVESLSDLGRVAPNFFYGQEVQSGSAAGQLYIRGVGQHDTQTTFNPSVGIYVDGVYVARATANDLDMLDVERVEVLYGPQGTLFGKNTNGGALNIVTRTPDTSGRALSGIAQLQGGDYGRMDAAVIGNLIVVPDRAGLTLSIDGRKMDGYSRRADGEQQADQNRAAARGQFLLKVTDSLDATLRFDGTTFNERSAAYRLVTVRAASTIPTLYAASTSSRYDTRWVTSSDFAYDGTGPNRNSGNVEGISLTFQWKLPWAELRSISAYRRLDVESDFDPDGSPLAVLDVFNHVDQHQLSQEIQAAGDNWSGRLRWVAGLYYFGESAQDDQPADVGLEYFHGAANFDPQLHVINRNAAAYSQLDCALTNQVHVTVGGRVGVDVADVGRIQVDFPDSVVEQAFVRKSASWTSFLPRASVEYRWTSQLMSYLSVAEGTKSGGFNGRAGSISEFNGFEPEKVWTYETGLRSDWLDQRLRLNATGYYSSYTDYQILLNSSVTDPSTGQPVPYSFVGNIPKATIAGGEAVMTALMLPGFTLSGGLGVTDGRYRRVLAGAPVSTQSQFVDAPKVTMTAGAEYAGFVLGQRVTARVDYLHKSTIQYDYSNSPLVAQRPFGLLSARLSWRTSREHWSLWVFGTNLTDVHYAIGGLDDGAGGSLGEVVKLMGAPRQWGVGSEFRF